MQTSLTLRIRQFLMSFASATALVLGFSADGNALTICAGRCPDLLIPSGSTLLVSTLSPIQYGEICLGVGPCPAPAAGSGGNAATVPPLTDVSVSIWPPAAVLQSFGEVVLSGQSTLTRLPLMTLIPTQSDAGWHYQFNVSTPQVTSVTIPYFLDAQFSAISGPADWSLSINTTDIFGLGNGAGYLQWRFQGLSEPTLNSIFSSTFPSGPADATYRVGLSDGTSVDVWGLIPLSPLTLAAGLQPFVSAVPEPQASAMMLVGLLVLCFMLRPRNPKTSHDKKLFLAKLKRACYCVRHGNAQQLNA
ncbi:hypothetical protein RCH09_003736 [Actimicrobium sp. GrIS 1.19]|uniref:hypothetical protein n=1 Tax=Actimicrobium sp. GrIS 1.19 TaxID=3071708 RepID=UPI002E052968|nr:hypothetical protein [Actimicrobium sp. GrIS 1.19]